ncbi:hypothetical protein TTHERM_00518700 (macronuclear) [Tetrahymena thermophila SB210]|uniref:Kinase domain protein n=1 Tax=Tetrahymena thermophila (strain SB210) TaxID=312017 RepID=I7M7P4_TETTS|nr:hypothetical protein TTHERM_00518700 [Tetrahymena thermophila SB210]EAR95038.2 hypothetical protein TTHERM_00518700 [Tetrahymena thermophila SB210]|eukprot:XP_001015283.2 hypothetical protein TTHERM_00518700 [Tetrahymena thermophila SB210]
MFPTSKDYDDSETQRTFNFRNKKLEYNQIGWNSSLQESDYSKIQYLQLLFQGNNIGTSGAEQFGKDLEKFQNLECLDLNLPQNSIRDQSFIDLCTSISKIKSLKEVYLAFWLGLQFIYKASQQMILYTKKGKTILQKLEQKNQQERLFNLKIQLDLVYSQGKFIYFLQINLLLLNRGNEIKDGGLQIIAENMKHLNKNIKNFQLSLWRNDLTDIGFRSFLENLNSLPNVIHLYLDFLYHNNVTDETAILLGKSLANLKHLRALQINIQETGITEVGQQELAKLISQIRQIVCLRYTYTVHQKHNQYNRTTKQTLKLFKKKASCLIFVSINSIQELVFY